MINTFDRHSLHNRPSAYNLTIYFNYNQPQVRNPVVEASPTYFLEEWFSIHPLPVEQAYPSSFGRGHHSTVLNRRLVKQWLECILKNKTKVYTLHPCFFFSLRGFRQALYRKTFQWTLRFLLEQVGCRTIFLCLIFVLFSFTKLFDVSKRIAHTELYLFWLN